MKVLGDRNAQMVIMLENYQLKEEMYKPVLSTEQFEKFYEYNVQTIKSFEEIEKKIRTIQN